MKQLHRFQIAIAILLGAFFTSLGYELQDITKFEGIPQSAAILAASFILSSIAAPLLVGLSVKLPIVRRILFRDHWIEGFWFNLSLDKASKADAHGIDAVTEIRFRDPSMGFQTVGYRLHEDQEVYTFSQYVVLVSVNNLYFNFYTSSAKGALRSLVGVGYFYRSPGGRYLDTYDGIVVELDGEAPFRQRATKLPPICVKDLQGRHGSNWVKALLSDPQEQMKVLQSVEIDVATEGEHHEG